MTGINSDRGDVCFRAVADSGPPFISTKEYKLDACYTADLEDERDVLLNPAGISSLTRESRKRWLTTSGADVVGDVHFVLFVEMINGSKFCIYDNGLFDGLACLQIVHRAE